MSDSGTSLAEAASLIRNASSTVALTGAGVSTESGIPDFRSHGGLWSRYDPVEYGTLGAFRRDPAKVWRMLAELLGTIDAQPNEGHRALARMEEQGLLDGIITQNIDGLHQKAGSRTVIEFHGSLATFTCPSCLGRYPLAEVLAMALPPGCDCGAILKPDVVFFDESIPSDALIRSSQLVAAADVLIVAGTSCRVTPAAELPYRCKRRGGRIVEINLEPALVDLADVCLIGGFSASMKGLEKVLAK